MKKIFLTYWVFFLWASWTYGCPEDEKDMNAGYVVIHTAKSLEAEKRKKTSDSQMHNAASSGTTGPSHLEENSETAESYINISRAAFRSPEDPPGIVPMVEAVAPVEGDLNDDSSRAFPTPKLFSLVTILKSDPYTVFISNGWVVELSPQERRALANEIAAKPIIKLSISLESLFSGVGSEYFINKLDALKHLKIFELSYAYSLSTEGWRLMGQALRNAPLENIVVRYTSMTVDDLLIFVHTLEEKKHLRNAHFFIHNLQESDFGVSSESSPYQIAQKIEQIWKNSKVTYEDPQPQEKKKSADEAFFAEKPGYYTLHFQISPRS
jgi:hypothetical protein